MTTKAINKATIRLVEARLFQYPIDKRLVDAWERESRAIAGDLPSSAAHLGEILKGSGLHSDPTFSKVIRLERMANQVDEARWYVRAIDDVMELLSQQERELIEKRYFKKETDTKICQDLHLSHNKYYKLKRTILMKFARRMGFL